MDKAYQCGNKFGSAKANLESLNRAAIHASLLSLYGLGGWLVNKGLMPFRVLASAIGFTFSLIFATQGILGTITEYQRMLGSLRRQALSCCNLPSANATAYKASIAGLHHVILCSLGFEVH